MRRGAARRDGTHGANDRAIRRCGARIRCDARRVRDDRAGAVDGLDASLLWLLVDTFYRLEQFDDALRALGLMEKRFPDDPRVDLNRGQVYALQNKFDVAMESLRKSVAKYPENALAHFELGKLLYQSNDLAAAKKALLEAVRLELTHALDRVNGVLNSPPRSPQPATSDQKSETGRIGVRVE